MLKSNKHPDLVAINVSPAAEHAVSYAVSQARMTNASWLSCVSVVDELHLLTLMAQSESGSILTDIIPAVRAESNRMIDVAKKQALRSGVAARGFVVSGEPVSMICELADEKRAAARHSGRNASFPPRGGRTRAIGVL